MNKNNDKTKSLKPLFFVFTCVKDGRQYIEKLFNSLLTQTKINFIHYIYEDGSDFPLDEMIDTYKKQVGKLKTPYTVVYEKNTENIGLNKATEHCIKKVTCPYFMWMNCDDWFDKNFFNKAEQYTKKHKKASIFKSGMIMHKNGKCTYHPKTFNHKMQSRFKNQIYPYIYGTFYFNHFIVKTDDYKQINPKLELLKDRDIYNDIQVMLPFLLKEKEFCYMPKAITNYYYHNNSEFFSTPGNGSLLKITNLLNLSNKNLLLEEKNNLINYGNDIETEIKNHNFKKAKSLMIERNKIIKKNVPYKYQLVIKRSRLYILIYFILKKLKTKCK